MDKKIERDVEEFLDDKSRSNKLGLLAGAACLGGGFFLKQPRLIQAGAFTLGAAASNSMLVRDVKKFWKKVSKDNKDVS